MTINANPTWLKKMQAETDLTPLSPEYHLKKACMYRRKCEQLDLPEYSAERRMFALFGLYHLYMSRNAADKVAKQHSVMAY